LDATLTTANDARNLQTQLNNVNSTLVPVSPNPVDVAWGEARPAYPLDTVFIHPVSFAGESFQAKIDKVQKHLNDNNAYGVIVSALDEVAWLLNLRGSDVDCNPVFYAYVLVTVDQTVLYIQQEKLTDEVKDYLQGVQIRPYHAVFDDLKALQAGLNGKKVFVDGSTSMAIEEAIGAVSPCIYTI
jgi:Xaa-Pro aminopeptidase